MDAKDLRTMPPRRWSEDIDGIRWLPRLIDKARAALSGKLGGYLFGQSPMDHGLLRELGLSHRAFAVIVKNAPDDAAVVAALRERDPASIERARAWSEPLAREHKMFLWFIDLDDGYRRHWMERPIAVAATLISGAAKRFLPSRAAERAAAETAE